MSDESPRRALCGVRVLVVDDECDVGETIATALRAFGAEVRCAASVAEARGCLCDAFDVVLTDLCMPRESGYDLLRDIRARPTLSAVPIAAVTARLSHDERRRIAEAGFDSIIPKPFELEALLTSVAALARRRF